jgi:hypothetical protein
VAYCRLRAFEKLRYNTDEIAIVVRCYFYNKKKTMKRRKSISDGRPWDELSPEEKKTKIQKFRDSFPKKDPEKEAQVQAEYEKAAEKYLEQNFVGSVHLLFLDKSEGGVLKMKNRIKEYLMEHQRQNPKLWDDVDWSKF